MHIMSKADPNYLQVFPNMLCKPPHFTILAEHIFVFKFAFELKI